MKIETIKTPTTEVCVETKDCIITATNWSNCEGSNVMITGKDLAVRMAAALTWEEQDALVIALTAARASP